MSERMNSHFQQKVMPVRQEQKKWHENGKENEQTTTKQKPKHNSNTASSMRKTTTRITQTIGTVNIKSGLNLGRKQ